TVTATYAGDTARNSSVSPNLTQTVNPANTSGSLTSLVNPSKHGQSVTFTATVVTTAPGAGTPTGNVQFKIDGTDFGSPVALSGGNQAISAPIGSLTPATHAIRAYYLGDANFTSSLSSQLNQVVNKASTSATVSGTPNPSHFGNNWTLNATVTSVAPGSGVPTGFVQFYIDGSRSEERRVG